MTQVCIGEPISWPRLERAAAGERTAAIDAHLDACAACRACLDEIARDVVALPALPPAPVRAPARWSRWLFAGGAAALAAAAVILLLVRRQPDLERTGPVGEVPPRTVAVKGAGAVVLSLVRERDGAIAFDPQRFRAGDRWKLRVTCDPGPTIWADAVVYQADAPGGPARASFPLAPAQVPCGNGATVPGAFRVDGGAPALICVALTTGAAPDRAVLAHGPRAGQVACAPIAPE